MGAWIAQHRKLIVPALGSVITIATLVWGAGNPWVIAVTAVALAAGVYRVPNDPRPAPAAPALPASPGGGGTGAVRVTGTEGGPVTGMP